MYCNLLLILRRFLCIPANMITLCNHRIRFLLPFKSKGNLVVMIIYFNAKTERKLST